MERLIITLNDLAEKHGMSIDEIDNYITEHKKIEKELGFEINDLFCVRFKNIVEFVKIDGKTVKITTIEYCNCIENGRILKTKITEEKVLEK